MMTTRTGGASGGAADNGAPALHRRQTRPLLGYNSSPHLPRGLPLTHKAFCGPVSVPRMALPTPLTPALLGPRCHRIQTFRTNTPSRNRVPTAGIARASPCCLTQTTGWRQGSCGTLCHSVKLVVVFGCVRKATLYSSWCHCMTPSWNTGQNTRTELSIVLGVPHCERWRDVLDSLVVDLNENDHRNKEGAAQLAALLATH